MILLKSLLEQNGDLGKACLTLQSKLIDYPYLELDPKVSTINDELFRIKIDHDLVKCFIIVTNTELKNKSINEIYRTFVSFYGKFFNNLKWFCNIISGDSTSYSNIDGNYAINLFSPFKDYESGKVIKQTIVNKLTFYFNNDKVYCEMTSTLGDVITVSDRTYQKLWLKIKEKISEYED